MLKKYTFVGMVDLHLSLMQFNTKLVLVNHTELRQESGSAQGKSAPNVRVLLSHVRCLRMYYPVLFSTFSPLSRARQTPRTTTTTTMWNSKEAFFQMTLRRFGVMPRLPLASPIAIPPLVRAALDLPEAGWTESDGDKDELAQVCD